MNKMRLKYAKGEEAKYISHLDLLRTFNRAIRRAHIPIAYSQGFNPHPIMSFGLPLSVGVTSETEYVDIELQSDMEANELVESLNGAMPRGLEILDAVRLPDKIEPIMKGISLANYRVKVHLKKELGHDFVPKIQEFMSCTELMVEKKGKKKGIKGMREVNIRPNIHKIDLISQENDVVILDMRLGAGSVSNLSPDLVLRSMEGICKDFEVDYLQVHRNALFIGEPDQYTDPMNV